ncbi:MAG: hypothetical protein AB7D07_07855 [Desulfovibrionaceae bacterium]
MSLHTLSLSQIEPARLEEFIQSESGASVEQKLMLVGPRSLHAANQSFVLEQDGRIVAVCPLFLESAETHGRKYLAALHRGLSLPGLLLSSHLSPRQAHKVAARAFEVLEAVCKERGVLRAAVNLWRPGGGMDRDVVFAELKRRGWLEISLQRQWLDVRLGRDQLKTGFRKGHKAIANKTWECRVEFFEEDSEPEDVEAFLENRPLCRKAAFTPEELFFLQREGNLDYARICEGKKEIGSGLFTSLHGRVQYLKAVAEDDGKLPVHHLLLLSAMQRFHTRGDCSLDLGVVVNGPYLNFIPSPKHAQIDHFKRGFGGVMQRFDILERFFDRDLFLSQWGDRLQHFADSYFPERHAALA